MLDPTFWRGRKVFLTGRTGFKGSWLSLWLNMLGAEVTGYALAPPTEPNLFEQANVAASMRSICGDIRDFRKLKSELAECRPDVVIHMAAQSVVRRGYDDPIETYSSNVMGTVHVLEALRQLGRACAVVNVTSDKCYSNREWVWGYREDEPMGGRDPYSNSKGCAELVTAAYRDSYFPPGAIDQHGIAIGTARAGNAIGGGDWTGNQLIPDLMRAFLLGKSCLIGIGGWNFGPADADAKPVSWLADRLVRVWGGGAAWTQDGELHPPEAHFLKLDVSKARAYLSWQPNLPLPKALDWIVEWYRAFQAGGDLRSLTKAQIERYETLLRVETDT
jgi:CDP-glucose 4,6-dehydratase